VKLASWVSAWLLKAAAVSKATDYLKIQSIFVSRSVKKLASMGAALRLGYAHATKDFN